MSSPPKKRTQRKKALEITAWCVFSDDLPLWMLDPYCPDSRQLQIYKTRREARATAQDVRRVTIKVEPS